MAGIQIQYNTISFIEDDKNKDREWMNESLILTLNDPHDN